jgi:ATP-dependent RNA helicase MSS116, mitochondrial
MAAKQYGYPKNWEGYIHRVGRTGRAGREGLGLLVLFPFEVKLLSTLSRRGLERNNQVDTIVNAPLQDNNLQAVLEQVRNLIGSGNAVLTPAAETAYLSLLAYYSARSSTLGMSGDEVVGVADSFLSAAGLKTCPEVSSSLLAELNLSDPQRLNTTDNENL